MRLRWIETVVCLLVMAASARSVRADVDTAPDRLETSLRVGGASISPWAGDNAGTGWFADAEAGLRYHDWTFAGFGSYLVSSRGQNAAGPLDARDVVVEIGARVTWHRGPVALGVGFMPFARLHDSGWALDGGAWDRFGNGSGLELHAGVDVWRIGRVPMQLFGLVEAATNKSSDDEAPALLLAAAQFGLGVTF
ncbi:MAG TPA: hypothetical protein VMJ10_32305 [Kofleriaceae bacterium]|nr:hypothetical protein [Kofleriaceae bacterium]